MDNRWDSLVEEMITLESLLSDPDVLSDQKRLRDVSRRYKELTPVVECIKAIRVRRSDSEAASELLAMTDSDAERDQLRAERAEAEADVSRLEEELRKFTDVFTTQDSRTGVKSFLENGPGKATFSGR